MHHGTTRPATQMPAPEEPDPWSITVVSAPASENPERDLAPQDHRCPRSWYRRTYGAEGVPVLGCPAADP